MNLRLSPYMSFAAAGALSPANDNGQLPAGGSVLGAFELSGVRRAPRHDMLVFVDAGTVEFVIAGRAGTVTAGGCARIPSGASYAYRNTAAAPALLVTHVLAPGAAMVSVA